MLTSLEREFKSQTWISVRFLNSLTDANAHVILLGQSRSSFQPTTLVHVATSSHSLQRSNCSLTASYLCIVRISR
jgi:hypothetical protein